MTDYRQRCADAAMNAWSMHAVVCDHSQTIPVGNLVDAVLAVENEVIADLNDLITQERTIHEQTIQEVARLRAESADLRAAVGRDIAIIGQLRQQLDAAQATRDETHVWTNTDWKERAEQAEAGRPELAHRRRGGHHHRRGGPQRGSGPAGRPRPRRRRPRPLRGAGDRPMTWVRRATADPHTCMPPLREVVYRPPSMSGHPPASDARTAPGVRVERPDGDLDDLWRCECGRLWWIWVALDFSLVWLPATLWQRIRYRKEGRT